ncbi:hypothetical protein QE436_000325 [Pantoea anthophila]|nr:hypothetical protein [Pantoea anthophila]
MIIASSERMKSREICPASSVMLKESLPGQAAGYLPCSSLSPRKKYQSGIDSSPVKTVE